MNTGIKLRNDFQLSSIFIIKLTTSIPNNCITTKTVTVATTLPVKLGSLINTMELIKKGDITDTDLITDLRHDISQVNSFKNL